MDGRNKNDEQNWNVMTRGIGSKRNARGEKKSECCHPAGPLAPYGLRQNHLGTDDKERVSRGPEDGRVSELLVAKGPLLVCLCVNVRA